MKAPESHVFLQSSTSYPVSFTVTQDLLNQALLNITLSAMVGFKYWNTKTNVTMNNSIDVFSFSRPLSLLLPYYISLAVVLPVLILGAFTFHQNGVSATDGGFIQLLTTTSGSSKLRDIAVGGCLGGPYNIPQELSDLKIRYGELVKDGEKGLVRRAGFGVEHEESRIWGGA